ncbi:MAG: hypothetical protein E7B29_06280, partial [Mixta calida]|nr:hypothetical protein [Mixta calida]
AAELGTCCDHVNGNKAQPLFLAASVMRQLEMNGHFHHYRKKRNAKNNDVRSEVSISAVS